MTTFGSFEIKPLTAEEHGPVGLYSRAGNLLGIFFDMNFAVLVTQAFLYYDKWVEEQGTERTHPENF